jgi:hypothetical protein
MSTSIFISYAHRDGADLTQKLHTDLQRLGFAVWLDRPQLKSGDSWTKEIENALNRAEVVLALLSEGSFQSDICRAEQGPALDAGKRVIPLKVHRDSKAQLRLHGLQWLDFSDPANYDQSLAATPRQHPPSPRASPPRRHPTPLQQRPALPDNFVDRPEILTALRNALFENAPNRNIALTALQGMGGIGKTELAQALSHNEVVQRSLVVVRVNDDVDMVAVLRQLVHCAGATERVVVGMRREQHHRLAVQVLQAARVLRLCQRQD